MRALRNGLILLVLLAAGAGGAYEWWNLDLRWRAHPITRDQAEIGKILQGSGWVSPKLSGPKLYELTYRDCDACARFEHDQFPALHAAGVDTRVIVFARDDLNGVTRSTPAERATVAELWVNRSWGLYQKWTTASAGDWTALGIAPADGDVARSAVVEVGRDTVERLAPLLKNNGVDLTYPVLIWWSPDGTMKGCACDDPRGYGDLRKDLAVH